MDFDFEKLYQMYPRKEGKKAGMEKLKKLITTSAEYAAFARAVENYTNLCDDERRDRRYVKHWGTFCNNWTDYAVKEPPGKAKTILRSQVDRILKGDL